LTGARLAKYDAPQSRFYRNKPNHQSMKIIISFFATLFLAAMTFAQEESPSPAAESTAAATEERASATVEETPAAKPMESTAPAMTAEKKAEPAKAASPAAAAKKESTANAAKPATSSAPAKTAAKNMAPRDAENAWEAAVGKHDYATVEPLVAADFIGVSAKNKFIGRSEMLSQFKGDKDTYRSAKNEKLNIKQYGNNVTVVTGRARETGTGKDGKAFDRTYLFTDTWMMRGGKWQCIASQITKIKG
jgi:ketosteroid isomerase-like protein